jgi:hypothetical protein
MTHFFHTPVIMQKDVLAAQLVGVGEMAHGELMSWPIRIRLLRAALAHGPVVVFMEHLHPYLAAMNVPGKFEIEDGKFYPFLMSDANMSTEHLAIHKRLRKLSGGGRVVFIGIDVQVSAFPVLWDALPGGDPATDAMVRAVIKKHSGGFKIGDGTVRNIRNAAIILDLMHELRAKASKFFYWAHNGHVGYGEPATRKPGTKFMLEGELLRRALPTDGYKAVLTYSPGPVWTFWGSPKQKRMMEPSPETRRFFKNAPKTMRMASLPVGIVMDELFTSSDADWVVVSPSSPRMTRMSQEKST